MTEGVFGMTYFRVLQYATVGFGCVCMFMSFVLFMHFMQSKRPIGKAVGFMLLGESVGALITVIFAITNDGLLEEMTDDTSALIMRWVMFSFAFVTSAHLAYQTWVIETDTDSNPDD